MSSTMSKGKSERKLVLNKAVIVMSKRKKRREEEETTQRRVCV